jgi:hypothetical protein
MTLTDIVTQLKELPNRLQDCDVEIDNESLTVSEFSYSERWGTTISIEELVEVNHINGEPARKWLVVDEESFDNLIDKLESKLNDDLDMERIKHTVDDITRATTNLRVLLGVTNADHSER